MALRYSGAVTIRVTWNDRYYNASVSSNGRNLWFGTVGAPKSSKIAADSPEAYDAAAHAALSFANNESEAGELAWSDGRGWDITRKPDRVGPTRRSNPARKRPAAKR